MTAMTERPNQFPQFVRHTQVDSVLFIMQSDEAGFKLTVLYLADTGLEVIQGHVADLIFEVGEIHGEG